jgi:hypothetical protein
MALQNFSTQLMELRRRAAVSGRPVAQTEAAGIAEGFAAEASERLARNRQLELQELDVTQSQDRFDEDLAFRQQTADRQYELALEANEESFWDKLVEPFTLGLLAYSLF